MWLRFTGPERMGICEYNTTYRFLHVTRLADVIPLTFEVRVRSMQGLFTAGGDPAAAIPTDDRCRDFPEV